MSSCSRPCLITSGAILDVIDDQHANQLYSSKNVGWAKKKTSDNVAKIGLSSLGLLSWIRSYFTPM